MRNSLSLSLSLSLSAYSSAIKVKVFLISLAAILIVSGFFVAVSPAMAAATVNHANDGTGISIDTTSALGGSGAYRTLRGPSFGTENGDIAIGTHTITLPAGWEFDTSTTITIQSYNDITFSSTSITPGLTTFSFEVTAKSTSVGAIGFSNLKIRPTGTTPSTDNMTYSGAGIAGVDENTNFGTLSTVPGTVAQLAFTTQPDGAVYGSELSSQPVVKTQDQFGNDSTNGLGADEAVTLTLNGSGDLLGTALLNIGAGTATFSDLAVNAIGEKQLTAAATTLASATSDSFDITPKTLTATITADNKIYDGSNSATFTSPTPVGAAFSDVLTLSGGSATFADANVGTSKTVTAIGLTFSGNNFENYTYNGTATGTADITPLEITVTPTTGQTKVYGNADPTFEYTFNPVLIGNDGFTGALSREEGEDVNTYQYEIGTLTDGLDNYSLTLIPGTFEITQRTLTVSATGIEKVYDATTDATVNFSDNRVENDELTLGYTAAFETKDVDNSKPVHVTGISITGGTDAGNYTLNGVTTAETSANITPKLLIISFTTDANKTYDGSVDANVIGHTLDGVIPEENVDVAGGSATFADKNVGSDKTVTAIGFTLTGADKNNYEIGTINTTTGNINPRPIVVTAVTDSKTYDGTQNSDETPAITSDSSPAIVGDDEANFIQTYDDKNVGENKTLTPSGIVNDNNDGNNYSYSFITDTTGEITKAPLTITADNQSKVYGTANPDLTAKYDGFVGGDTSADLDTLVSLSTLANETSPVDTYEITASDAVDANYNITFTPGILTVTPAPITITVDAKSKVYGEDDTELTYQITSSSLVNGDTLTGSLSRAAGENVGAYAITSTLTNSNYNITFIGADFTITAKPITVTAATNSKTYDGTMSATAIPTFPDGSLIGTDTANFIETYDDKNVGENKILTPRGVVIDGNNGNNYSYTFNDTTGVITRVTLTITADDQSKVYGTANPNLTASYVGFMGEDTSTDLNTPASLSTSADETSPVSTYEITVSGATAANYDIAFASGTLTVRPAPITITADTQTKVYGDDDPLLTYQITSGSLVNEDTLIGSLSRAAGENVGAYAITSTLTNSNYDITFVGADFTITAKPITVTADDSQTKVYGEADPIFAYTFNPALIGLDSFTGVLSRIAGENVGNYAYEIGTLTAGSNYSLNLDSDTFAITQKPITITADAKTKSYGTPDPDLTYQITSGELIEGDLISGSLTRDVGEDLGSYTINQGTVTAGDNYAVTYISGTLTILDTTPPTVLSYTPSINALNISPTTPIIITFSEAVNVENGNVSFSPTISGGFTITNSGTNVVTITPSNPLANNTTYTITLAGVTDLSGNALPTYSNIKFTTATTYSINLNANASGWNLISLPVIPSNTAIAAVLGNAADNIDAVWSYDPTNPNAVGGWLVYVPGNPSGTNNLDRMTTGFGYWLSVTDNANLYGSGTLLIAGPTPPPSRSLQTGWNLIGYYQLPGEANSTPINAFASLQSWSGLWGFNNTTGIFNSVTTINPGDGFWISLTSDKIYTPSN
ncbi:MAG: MBG domain-containing protein [Candidatus Komeilibacteria bacterium]|nr:MBG domain-containing protein [Candidatus Komeilibacteria bacterium]